MGVQAQSKKPDVAANDAGLLKTAWRTQQQQPQQQQQSTMSPVLRLINRGQQEAGKVCL